MALESPDRAGYTGIYGVQIVPLSSSASNIPSLQPPTVFASAINLEHLKILYVNLAASLSLVLG